MSTIKTQVNDEDVVAFLDTIENETRKTDAFILLKLYSEIIDEPPKMWGSGMIGFGSYHYKSERSSQEGDWPLSAFSPRKQALTLYVTFGFEGCEDLLAKLGKHKTSKACLYINKLADIDTNILTQIVQQSHQVAIRELTYMQNTES